ncbi:MAG: hypothetical protein K9G76_10215 [Bacteroidales bacterium]|nr:hypothetical protein [Bacteroidales bacterium]MCF8404075.1 hypothetical protein [Bacteroidales bacterium]
MEKVKYVKHIEVIKEGIESGIFAIKATGIANLNNLLSPVLVNSDKNKEPAKDGIYELDFVLGSTGNNEMNVELEVDVVFKFKQLPAWVKGIKVNAEKNSDIELI